jgi:methyl-accepting chemotaxis protein
VLEAVSEISVALREQAAASTEIAQSVERIAQMAEENNIAVPAMPKRRIPCATWPTR